MVSRDKAQEVLRQVYERLHVAPEDGSLIIEGLAQIRHVVSAKLDVLSHNVPVDINTLSRLDSFFALQYTYTD